MFQSCSFLGSVISAAFLEIIGQGSSAIAFNWWLRAETVNNLSVVIVSDVFYVIFFGIISLFLIWRLVSKWNDALVARVSSITHSSVSRKSMGGASTAMSMSTRASLRKSQQQQIDKHNVDNNEKRTLLDDNNNNENSPRRVVTVGINNNDDTIVYDDNSGDTISANDENDGANTENNNSYGSAPVNDVQLCFGEIWFVLKHHFLGDPVVIGWLVLAGLADTILSLFETYSAGQIAVLTQLFIKAGEPIIVWLLALKWRKSERMPRTVPITQNTDHHHDPSTSPLSSARRMDHHHANDGTMNDEPSLSSSSSPFSIRNFFSNYVCCCCIGCFNMISSVSSKRLLLSGASLVFVACGIGLHFAIKIKKDIEEGKSHSDNNPVGFILMYVGAVIFSALYAIAYGRYIFLVRRIAVHTDPLDVVDLHRGLLHDRITEHQTVDAILRRRSVSAEAVHHRRTAAERRQRTRDGNINQDENDNGDDNDADVRAGRRGEELIMNDRPSTLTNSTLVANDVISQSFADDNIQQYDADEGAYYKRGSVLSESTLNGGAGAGSAPERQRRFYDSILRGGSGSLSSSVLDEHQHREEEAERRRELRQQQQQQSRDSNNNNPSVILSPESDHGLQHHHRTSSSRQRRGRNNAQNNNAENNNNVSSSKEQEEVEEEELSLAIAEKNRCSYGATAADVRVIACTLEVTIAFVLSMFVAPCLELMPGGVGQAKGWSDLLTQTGDGIKALSASSTLVFAIVTMAGWAFVYAADSVLNHLSAPLTSLITQLASPLTAILLLLVPALDASTSSSKEDDTRFFSFGEQLIMKIGSCILVLIGSVLMYFAERYYAD